MIELTHSLNKKMADRYLYDRYDKFSEENLPSEYFSLDDDSIRVDIPQDETKIKKLMDEVMCLIYMEPDNPYNYHTTGKRMNAGRAGKTELLIWRRLRCHILPSCILWHLHLPSPGSSTRSLN